MTGNAAAQVENYQFNGTTIEGASDDGSLSEIRVWVENGTFGYEGLENAATTATVELQAVYNGSTHTIASTTREDISGQSQHDLAFERLEGDVLAHPDLSASKFESGTDGETVTTDDVDLQLTVTVTTTTDATVSGSVASNLTVVMTNTESTASGGGSTGGSVRSYETIAQSDDGWQTLKADFGEVTHFKIELDPDHYEDGVPEGNNGTEWPDNPDEYFQEVIVDHGADGPTDEYRFGFHGPGGLGSTDNTEGYIRANYGTDDSPDRKDFGENEDIEGFTASESDDKLTYTFTVDWTTLGVDGDLAAPGKPGEVYLEAFGGDGGEGRMGSTGTVYYNVK
ncbi:hypothetical protein [Halopiger aswanensis]|uniref:Uncharacterized protein n=1 Tax=Halopiger aswanensis TaxID=148449 RepID=A0A3R7KLS7_9EURY|nr:hypothetical protein [Halopiger aswanensis]RKD95814.1 hypothetical protein ATJ93_2677 [Halopiger aswanensis]